MSAHGVLRGDKRAAAAPASTGAEFVFVNNVRFVSMMAIVAAHSELVPSSFDDAPLSVAITQLSKFSTVCFFVISGFLLGERLDVVPPWRYLARRFDAIFAPWLLWATGYGLLRVVFDRVARGASMHSMHTHVTAVFVSAYWFVPNMLASLALLVALRRRLDSVWLGLGLGAVTAFYGLNLYAHWWTETRHTTAWFDFAVFLWLGYQLRRIVAAVRARVERTSWAVLGLAAASAYVASLVEAWVLRRATIHPVSYLSTLRPTNIVWSLAVFALLFKVTRNLAPRRMNVRRHTYGIYLAHTVVFALISRLVVVAGAWVAGVKALAFSDHLERYVHGAAARAASQIGVFAAVYLVSWAMVSRVAETRLTRWVGARG